MKRAGALLLAAMLAPAQAQSQSALQSQSQSAAQLRYTLYYEKPASIWTEALPVGNGRLGAMVFGDAGDELLQLTSTSR